MSDYVDNNSYYEPDCFFNYCNTCGAELTDEETEDDCPFCNDGRNTDREYDSKKGEGRIRGNR